MDERRRFERVKIPESAKVQACAPGGQALGPVRVLGKGGLMVGMPAMAPGERRALVIVDDSEGIRRSVRAVSRYNMSEGVAFEFEELEAEAAVEIGVIIGKYYARGSGA